MARSKNAPIGKSRFLFPVLTAALLVSCASHVDFRSPMQGKYVTVRVAAKDFEVVGKVSLTAVKVRTGSPLGILRSAEGSGVLLTALVREAALLGADEIIDVRIDRKVYGRTGLAGFLRGWERMITYTGTALAIRYVDRATERAAPPEYAVPEGLDAAAPEYDAPECVCPGDVD